jgi:hypothetical protein
MELPWKHLTQRELAAPAPSLDSNISTLGSSPFATPLPPMAAPPPLPEITPAWTFAATPVGTCSNAHGRLTTAVNGGGSFAAPVTSHW